MYLLSAQTKQFLSKLYSNVSFNFSLKFNDIFFSTQNSFNIAYYSYNLCPL